MAGGIKVGEEDDWIKRIVATEEEDRPVVIQKAVCAVARRGWENVLIGKFVGQNSVESSRVRELFRLPWCLDSDLRVLEEGGNVFLFKFPLAECKDKAMYGRPWCYEDQLLFLQEWDISRNPREASFTDVWVGIQIKGLPLRLLDKDVGTLIGASIGEVKWVSVHMEGEERDRCIRAKTRIKAYRPLRRRVHVVTEDGDDLMVRLVYECIPKLCNWCGCVDHESGSCSRRAKMIEERKEPDYGDWLLQKQGQKRKLTDSHAHEKGRASTQRKNTSLNSKTSSSGKSATSNRPSSASVATALPAGGPVTAESDLVSYHIIN